MTCSSILCKHAIMIMLSRSVKVADTSQPPQLLTSWPLHLVLHMNLTHLVMKHAFIWDALPKHACADAYVRTDKLVKCRVQEQQITVQLQMLSKT